MFGSRKSREDAREVVETTNAREVSDAETLGLKEYISVDSIKAHFVDILEENRSLKQKAESDLGYMSKRRDAEKKEKEIALIEADEWKKRAKEKDEEINQLRKQIKEKDNEIEHLTMERNDLKVEAEMRRAKEQEQGGA